MNRLVGTLLATALLLGAEAARADARPPLLDFGKLRDSQLRLLSLPLFGISGPLAASSTASVTAAEAQANPLRLATFARSLHARVVSARPELAPNIDMMVLWPAAAPTHLVACNEEGTAQPALQRIRLADGAVETMLTGMVSCDPVRRTAWGTLVAGEEAGAGGQLLEIIDPLAVTGVLFDRATGTTSGGTGAANVVVRTAVGKLSFEGIALYPNGVMYYGDENRPGTGTAGGAYFKFVPAIPFTGTAPIADLAQSPLASGKVYGLRLGRRSGATDYGQGSNTGLGTWVEVPADAVGNLRAAAASLKLTGYYRPEDLDIDGDALRTGHVRFCGPNTGNESDDRNWGEVVCITDGTVAESLANTAVPELQVLVIGTPELAMPDNIAWQPGRGSWIVHEDGDGPLVGRNNDLWACLEDGDDDDSLSDGCIRIGTLNDLNAEWTGGFFDPTGTRFYVSVQHNVTGHGVILEVTGWR
jgi:hypothetical protein